MLWIHHLFETNSVIEQIALLNFPFLLELILTLASGHILFFFISHSTSVTFSGKQV